MELIKNDVFVEENLLSIQQKALSVCNSINRAKEAYEARDFDPLISGSYCAMAIKAAKEAQAPILIEVDSQAEAMVIEDNILIDHKSPSVFMAEEVGSIGKISEFKNKKQTLRLIGTPFVARVIDLFPTKE